MTTKTTTTDARAARRPQASPWIGRLHLVTALAVTYAVSLGFVLAATPRPATAPPGPPAPPAPAPPAPAPITLVVPAGWRIVTPTDATARAPTTVAAPARVATTPRPRAPRRRAPRVRTRSS
jgi:hypothetical protein